ncbi:phage tail protein [Rhodoferax sp.]|uniref:phage tail protein n=1 Tax=Rhodoferax sp. TaxID=50421 RepID=UPI00262881D0|nr:phage tail protein [Rhodoferax sp.]MDD3938090.1 phage tail protein [Rhodoferax sp.]
MAEFLSPDPLAADVLALDARFGPLAVATQRLGALELEGLLTYLVDTVPSEFLPELGRQFHIMPMEGWQFAVSDDARRELIRTSIALHKKKGTPWALRRILAAAGFGDASRLTEGGAARVYGGAIFADGSEVYGGQSWAEFAIDMDLGESAVLDVSTPAQVRAIVDAWRPVGRHLMRLAWHADTVDVADSAELALTGAALQASSQRPWRRVFDGALHYDQGRVLDYSGAVLANGLLAYQGGWVGAQAQWLAGVPESDSTLDLALSAADRVQHLAVADGATLADGWSDYGETAPVAEDAPMPLWATRHVLFDGHFSFGADNLHDGRARFDGARFYTAGTRASGNQSFYLEAA